MGDRYTWVAINIPGKLGISINYCILCDSSLRLQVPLRSRRRHTLQHLNAAVKKCHPHILSAWAWHLTSPSSTTRSGTAQMQPANWLNKYANIFTKNLSHCCLLSGSMWQVLNIFLSYRHLMMPLQSWTSYVRIPTKTALSSCSSSETT